MSGASPRVQYDCTKCLAFCCSIYEIVEVTKRDLYRLAGHFGISVAQAERRFTKMRDGTRVLRRRKDALLGTSCRWLDPDTRGCTIYHARPKTCRDYPGKSRCSYYDTLRFEQEIQKDETIVPVVRLTFMKRKKAAG